MAKLFIGSLPFSVTDDSLLQLFTDKGYRPISAKVIIDKFSGQSRGFGFVELGPGEDKEQAIGELNGFYVDGRSINVSEAHEREDRGGGGRGFSGSRSGHGRGRH